MICIDITSVRINHLVKTICIVVLSLIFIVKMVFYLYIGSYKWYLSNNMAIDTISIIIG
jgi:hypothetical protein